MVLLLEVLKDDPMRERRTGFINAVFRKIKDRLTVVTVWVGDASMRVRRLGRIG